MSAAQGFAETYAEELRYRTKAKVSYYGPHATTVDQGMPAILPANSVRVKANVHEFLVTFGQSEVTVSGSNGDGGGFAHPGFMYSDGEMYDKLDRTLMDKGVVFSKTRLEWKRHKGLA
jgi:hypothetical protein